MYVCICVCVFVSVFMWVLACVCVCVRARKCVCMRFHGIRLGEMWKTRSSPVSMETPSFERRAAGPLCIERMQNALFPITERSHDHAAL